jgi:hypothetical protein
MNAILTALALLALPADKSNDGPFAQRGYSITFMRMPTYDLADWKRIVDGIHDDGGNTLLLWVAGCGDAGGYGSPCTAPGGTRASPRPGKRRLLLRVRPGDGPQGRLPAGYAESTSPPLPRRASRSLPRVRGAGPP